MALRRKVWRVGVAVFDSDAAEMRRNAAVMLKTENNSPIQSGGAVAGDTQNFLYWSYHHSQLWTGGTRKDDNAAYFSLKLCRMQDT